MATEKRLIDANALEYPKWGMRGLSEYIRGYRQGKFDAYCEVKMLAPTVDAVEVVHGWWIHKNTCGPHTAKFHCSVCDKIPRSLCPEDYCPNCGARMDGGSK